MEKILVLGGYGFLGKALVKKIKEDLTLQVFLASRRTGLNLLCLESTRNYLQDVQPDVIYNCVTHGGSLHYVTKFSADIIRDNIQTSLNLYQAVKDICPTATIINPLANCSYPGDALIHYEPDWLHGPVHSSVSSFANSKRIVYFISESFKNQYGIKSKNFILPNAFGPGDSTDPNKAHAINGMILRMIEAKKSRKETFEVWGSGNPIREWGYIEDLAEILLLGKNLEEDLTYPVNIAQNKGYSIRESAEIISDLVNFKGGLFFNTEYPDGAKYKILDDRNFKSLFPRYLFSSHRNGIKNTIEYYVNLLITGDL